MIEPSITLKTAVRAALIAAPNVTALVPIPQIRAGLIRPDKVPTVIMGDAQTQHLGRASGGQYLTRVYLEVRIWAMEDGADVAQKIGQAVSITLWDAPSTEDCIIVEYGRPSFQWLRDPQPEKSHTQGIATIEAVIQWRV